MFEFVYPLWLWALAVIPLYLAYELLIKEKKKPKLNYNRFDILKKVTSRSHFMRYLPLIIRTLVLISLIIAIARPRLAHREEVIRGKGLDIMLVVDVSGSMQALDFKPNNRLEAAKTVTLDFVDQRKNDRIGVVVFAPNAYTLCPLTTDYNLLRHIIENIGFPHDASGTAIGMGLATAVARLQKSEAENKIILLVTDGANNTGEIDPITAANLAATYGIKVYAVGIGSDDLVDFPFEHPRYGTQYRRVKIDYDMDTLHEIASITGVDRAWEAQDTQEFERVIKEIDSLEPSEYEIEHYYRYTEIFHWFLSLAFSLLILELLLRTVIKWELV